MSKIAETFDRLNAKGEKALIPYITAGDPDLPTTGKLLETLMDAGADIIELGIPFSDPMADGPTIQRAAARALARGTNLPQVLDLVEKMRAKITVPIVLFGYYNPIFSFGPEAFARRAAQAGIDGVLVVDLPPEEAAELKDYTAAGGIDFINLISPVTDGDRLARIVSHAQGFLYYVSVTGVTGARAELPPEVNEDVARVKSLSDLPVVVGFGVSRPEMAARLAQVADGVVVGSALVNIIAENGAQKDLLLPRVHEFISALKAALR